MRFITEFLITSEDRNHAHADVIDYRKQRGLADLSNLINESFGWVNPVYNNENRFRLEIEAFPVDKWIEFKQKLFSKFIDDDYENAGVVLEMIKELEFNDSKQLTNDKPKE